jgi:transcriptional regulator with XRE-family HTH domain
MLFREKLRELRLAAGLTQENLARKAGMTVASIRNQEQGQRLPGWLAVVKLAKALEVSTDVFSDCAQEEEEAEQNREKRKGGAPKGTGKGIPRGRPAAAPEAKGKRSGGRKKES